MKKKLVLLFAATVLCSTIVTSQIKFGIQVTGANLDIGKQLGISGATKPGPPTNAVVGFELVDIYSLGYGGGVHLDINLPVLFSFRVEGDYVTFTPNETKYRDILKGILPQLDREKWLVEGGRINAWTVFANVKLSPLPIPVITPYATGGIGLANIGRSEATLKYDGTEVTRIAGTDATTNTSANAGVGVDIGLGAVNLFAEVRLTWIFTEGGATSMLPLGTIGLTF